MQGVIIKQAPPLIFFLVSETVSNFIKLGKVFKTTKLTVCGGAFTLIWDNYFKGKTINNLKAQREMN